MYSEEAVKCFLKEQSRLFDEPVAETAEEAGEVSGGVYGCRSGFSERSAQISG